MTLLILPGNLATIDLRKRTKRIRCGKDRETTASKKPKMTCYL
jgi:hypothetical protein